MFFNLFLLISVFAFSSAFVFEENENFALNANLSCSDYTACSNCTSAVGCAFCTSTSSCMPEGLLSEKTCNGTACAGLNCNYICKEPCEAKAGPYPCSDGVFGQVLLMLFYGAILGGGAKLISDGSELLLELFPAWGTVIGALLLPILGAVPDAAIILVSGFGPREIAQQNVAVGVGTLAGSTIMLLTIAWVGSGWVGRCDFNEFGEAMDGVCGKFSVRHQGISVDQDTPTNARIMLATSILYLIIQIPAFFYIHKDSAADQSAAIKTEGTAAMVGMIVAFIALLGYCVYQMIVPRLAKKRVEAALQKAEEKNRQLKAVAILSKFPAFAAQASSSASKRVAGHDGEAMAQARIEATALAVGKRWKAKALAGTAETSPLLGSVQERGGHGEGDHDDDDEEHDPRDHFCKNLCISFALMVIGTALVAIFSDPMVDVIGDFGKTVKIPPFFVSFIITPFCSNASELLSSLIFASKKRIENASLTYSQIYGAATMNNTMCLGIFYALIHFQGLTWAFSAETMAILMVTWMVGLPAAFRQNFSMMWYLPILLIYPLSLVLVVILESPAINWT